MAAYDLDQIIHKITEKTDSGEIIWIPYDLSHDTNPYSLQYFSTIKELNIQDGYSSKFQNGFIFLIPGINCQYYLFLQADSFTLPVALNYGSSYLAYSAQLEVLYHKITESFNPLDTFLSQLLS